MLSARELRRSARRKPKIVRVWRWLKIVLLVICGGALIYSGIHIASYFFEGSQDLQVLQDVRQVYARALEEKEPVQTDSLTDEASLPDHAAQNAYLALSKLNADASGWLSIPGTGIDHPFVQTGDNVYYLKHSFEGARSSHGCMFLDYRCNADSRHLVIYGHRMKDGSMFGGLPQYEIEDYYAAHPVITLNLRGELSQWQIFSAHRTDDSLMPVLFADDDTFDEYIQSLKASSLYDTGINVASGDTVLTLSTCDGADSERFVIHAKKIN